MAWWGTFIGGTLGYVFGGPLGAGQYYAGVNRVSHCQMFGRIDIIAGTVCVCVTVNYQSSASSIA